MKRPTGAVVCAVLFFIGGILGVLFGVMMLARSFLGVIVGAGGPPMAPVRHIVSGSRLIGGLISLVLGGLDFLVGWGIYTLKDWARIGGIILGVLSLFAVPIGTIIGLVILYFLVLDKETVAAFRSGAGG